jgi:hypothetical protein
MQARQSSQSLAGYLECLAANPKQAPCARMIVDIFQWLAS